MKSITKRYSKDDVTVVWAPDKCIHSGICFRGLAPVFDPRRKPWIIMDNASSSEIIAQVKKCPSGALSLANKAED